MLGHEVVAETADGRARRARPPPGLRRCARCRAGHESTCAQFPQPTIVPGGFAERVRATAGSSCRTRSTTRAGRSSSRSRACCAEPSVVPRGRVLVVGHGFIGRLFGAVLERRGDDGVRRRPPTRERAGPAPDGPVDAAVLCAPGGAETALAAVEPGGTLLVFADAGPLPATPSTDAS